jgi:hypothetical protein
MATVRQIAANQRNAMLSTGPTSDKGKAISRRNAVQHGMAGNGVDLPDDEAEKVNRRVEEFAAVIRPANAFEAFYVVQLATESVRVERCQCDERVLLLRRAARAETGWDEDRRLASEELAAHLARDPARTVRRLRQTSQGCDWLIDRWHMLARTLDAGHPWDDARRALTLDLLGIPAAMRDGLAPLDADTDAKQVAHQQSLAAERIKELEQLKADVMDDRDEFEHEAAVEGMGSGDAATERSLALTRRYESACQRRLERAWRQLLSSRLPERAVLVPEREREPDPEPACMPPVAADRATSPEPAPSASSEYAPEPAVAERRKGNARWRKEQQRRDRERHRARLPDCPIESSAAAIALR